VSEQPDTPQEPSQFRPSIPPTRRAEARRLKRVEKPRPPLPDGRPSTFINKLEFDLDDTQKRLAELRFKIETKGLEVVVDALPESDEAGKSRLPRRVRLAIVRMLADWIPAQRIAERIKEEFGVTIARTTVASFKTRMTPEESKYADDLKVELEAQLSEIPISRRYYRMEIRQKLLEKALANSNGDSKEIRCLLLDAAREMGHLAPAVSVTNNTLNITPVQITMMQKVLALPPDALRQYAESGIIPVEVLTGARVLPKPTNGEQPNEDAGNDSAP